MIKQVEFIKSNLSKLFSENKQQLNTIIPLEYSALIEASIDILAETLSKSDDLTSLVFKMFEEDPSTYNHSVHVAALSAVTAKSLAYDFKDIMNIAIGGFLHDIGKMLIDAAIIGKPSALTDIEKEAVEKHPKLGYDFIKDIEALSYTTKQIVLLHHEKLDGTGYPCQLSGIEIPEFVRIVTICDMYDAMTSNRVYRQQMPIYVALEILMTDAIYKIDQKIYSSLIDNICIFPPGSGVVLSDGRMGMVTSYRPVNPSRPHVRVVDFKPEIVDIVIENINLEENRTLFITEKWNPYKDKPRY